MTNLQCHRFIFNFRYIYFVSGIVRCYDIIFGRFESSLLNYQNSVIPRFSIHYNAIKIIIIFCDTFWQTSITKIVRNGYFYKSRHGFSSISKESKMETLQPTTFSNSFEMLNRLFQKMAFKISLWSFELLLIYWLYILYVAFGDKWTIFIHSRFSESEWTVHYQSTLRFYGPTL